MADQRPGGGFAGLVQASEAEFRRIKGVILEKSGIDLNEAGRELYSRRLGARIKALGLASFGEYNEYITGDGTGRELMAALDAFSINSAGFFGEPERYKYLTEELAPAAVKRAEACGVKELRGWSADCAFGEEAYSMAIALLECRALSDSPLEVKILATDISQEALERAQAGEYPASSLERVPARLLARYFDRMEGEGERMYKIKPQAAQLARFRRFALTSDPFPFRRKFHFISCENAMIYFDGRTRQALAEKFFEALEPGGALFIGRAESLTGLAHGFKYVQPAVYRKPEPAESAA